MLFTSIVLMVVGYTMVYSAFHGTWQFWTYFFPQESVAAARTATVSQPSATAS